MKIEEQVKEIIEPIINDNNYHLDEVIYVLEGKTYFLRIIIKQ